MKRALPGYKNYYYAVLYHLKEFRFLSPSRGKEASYFKKIHQFKKKPKQKKPKESQTKNKNIKNPKISNHKANENFKFLKTINFLASKHWLQTIS